MSRATNAAMIATYVAELERVLSADRLHRYRQAGDDDLAMVAVYLWNVGLCESLYHSLGALEVALRNSIHNALTEHFGRADWYDQRAFLQRRQRGDITKAKKSIVDAGKAIIPGRVVAGLSFGFWTSLLSGGYGHLWSQNGHALVKQAFPFAPVRMQYRGRIFAHVNSIRLLRNRVFHYEPICDDPDILNKHAAIFNAIGWITPPLQATTIHFDRFLDVHQNARATIEAGIIQHLRVI